MGMSKSGYIKLERSERRLKDESIDRAARVFDVSQSEVIGDMAAIGQLIPLISWVNAGEMLREDLADESLGELKLSDLPLGDWIALKVIGDSMDRVSPPESIILVNRREKVLVPNGLYIIADEDGKATYKRFRPDPMRFEPVSVNPEHQTIYPDQEPVIIGRVRRTILNH